MFLLRKLLLVSTITLYVLNLFPQNSYAFEGRWWIDGQYFSDWLNSGKQTADQLHAIDTRLYRYSQMMDRQMQIQQKLSEYGYAGLGGYGLGGVGYSFAQDPNDPLYGFNIFDPRDNPLDRHIILDLNNAIAVRPGDVNKYIKGLRFEVVTDPPTADGRTGQGHLVVHGYMHRDCARQFSIEFDNYDDARQIYPVRLYRYNYRDQSIPNDCSEAKTNMCRNATLEHVPQWCVEINQHPTVISSKGNGFDENFFNTSTGTNTASSLKTFLLPYTGAVAIRTGDINDIEGGNDTFVRLDYQSNDGRTKVGRTFTTRVEDRLDYKDERTLLEIEQLQDRADRRAIAEQIRRDTFQACNEARRGNRDAFQVLVDAGLDERLIRKIEEDLQNKELQKFEQDLASTDSLSRLQILIRELQEFALNNPKVKPRVTALLVQISEKAMELESEQNSNAHSDRQYRTATQALTAALKVDPSSQQVRLAKGKLKRDQFSWKAQVAGELGDFFSISIIKKEAERELQSLQKYAKRSRNPEVMAEIREYERLLRPRPLPPYGQIGTGFDEIYNTNKQRVAENNAREMLEGYSSSSSMNPYIYNSSLGGYPQSSFGMPNGGMPNGGMLNGIPGMMNNGYSSF